MLPRQDERKKKDITQETYGLDLSLDDMCCYRRVYHDIVVFWDGKTYPCCSTFNRATEGIVLGNANEVSLRELYERAEGSLMFRVMKRHGFEKFYEIIKELDPELYVRLPDGAETVGPCGLCNSIFRSPEIAGAVYRAFTTYEQRKVGAAIDVIARLTNQNITMEFIKGVLGESVENSIVKEAKS